MPKTEEQKRDAAKDARLKKFFRTSLEEYRAIEALQDARDCYRPVLGTTRRGLDHRHSDGLIRGVLDWRVNRALGMIEEAFKDRTSEVLRAMALYWECPPALEIVGHRFGIIGKAKNKKVMIYGSENGPLPPIKQKRKKKIARKPKRKSYVVNMSYGDGPIGNTD